MDRWTEIELFVRIAETGSVFVALAVFGYFIRRSAKKEREEEKSDRDRS